MSQTEIEQEFVDHVYVDNSGSVDIALETVKSQIGWLEYVPESQLTESEKERVLYACQKFYNHIRPLTHKYID